MNIGIVTDSTCDLPASMVEQSGIQVVPTILVLDGKEYADGEGISRREFYERLPQLKTPPSTAAPSIGDFTSVYEGILSRGGEHIISLHAASGLSATCSSAEQAAREFPGRVTVVDSRSLSLGLGFQALAAAEAAEGGVQAMLEAIESTRRREHVFAVLDTLQYARRSGRIPAAITIFGGLLHVKPMIELSDGSVKAVAALRTSGTANERMARFFREGGEFERLAILHTGAEERGRSFLRGIMRENGLVLPREILMVNVTPVIGAHVGPNGLGFAAVRR